MFIQKIQGIPLMVSLLLPYLKYFDFESTIPCNYDDDNESKCCYVEVHCVCRNAEISTKITKYKSQCQYTIEEVHGKHVFYVTDQKDFDWTACECEESSDSSSS